ncbi:hypothetical protein OCU04_005378 [Sclerotinia nivalis]|uniref:Uncharacterized protein n=1 Tax=Sclerotinia nivalis TaxID=352851 RepID=A0A9X0AP03_9HELO|nr:hypothetical protein OCU04_005378 [Sclerotinia nivalis]
MSSFLAAPRKVRCSLEKYFKEADLRLGRDAYRIIDGNGINGQKEIKDQAYDTSNALRKAPSR